MEIARMVELVEEAFLGELNRVVMERVSARTEANGTPAQFGVCVLRPFEPGAPSWYVTQRAPEGEIDAAAYRERYAWPIGAHLADEGLRRGLSVFGKIRGKRGFDPSIDGDVITFAVQGWRE